MNKLQREPVLTSALVTAVLEALIILAIQMGWVDWNADQIASVNNFVIALTMLLAVIVPAYFARGKVTPMAAPRTKDGEEAELVKVVK